MVPTGAGTTSDYAPSVVGKVTRRLCALLVAGLVAMPSAALDAVGSMAETACTMEGRGCAETTLTPCCCAGPGGSPVSTALDRRVDLPAPVPVQASPAAWPWLAFAPESVESPRAARTRGTPLIILFAQLLL